MRKEELRTYIENHESEMIEDLKSLIRIPSEKQAAEPGKPFGAPAAEALAQGIEILEKYGFAVTNYDNYAIAADFNQEEKGLDILAHLDVVPAGEGWQETDPFTPLIKEGKMFGRGTADDKGPAIAAIYAMRAVKELGYPLKKNVRLVLGSDEECGSSDLEYYYKKEVEAPCTFSRMPNSRSSTLKRAACAVTSKNIQCRNNRRASRILTGRHQTERCTRQSICRACRHGKRRPENLH